MFARWLCDNGDMFLCSCVCLNIGIYFCAGVGVVFWHCTALSEALMSDELTLVPQWCSLADSCSMLSLRTCHELVCMHICVHVRGGRRRIYTESLRRRNGGRHLVREFHLYGSTCECISNIYACYPLYMLKYDYEYYIGTMFYTNLNTFLT